MTPFANRQVALTFEGYPPLIRPKLLALRELIFRTAATTPGVGALDETLKWREPAYVTSVTNSGSTIRIGWKKSTPLQYAIYFNCQTSLIETFRMLFRAEFRFEGNRAIVFNQADALPIDALTFCIAAALTYHRRKHAAHGRRVSRVSDA